VFFKDLIAKHAATSPELGVDLNNGFGDLVAKLDKLPADQKAEIEADIQAAYAAAPPSPWSTPTRASPTSTCPATSSSTPPCPR
jgi:monomeric isocitrate dehydrogenase